MPSQNDRIMAALTHLSVLMPFWGIVAPVVIWVTHRDKSQFVAFQALQALAYHIVLLLAGLGAMGCYVCSFIGMFLTIPWSDSPGGTGTPSSEPPLFFFFPFITMGVFFVGMIVFQVYGLIGAIRSLQGKDFRYLFVGARVQRFLEQN